MVGFRFFGALVFVMMVAGDAQPAAQQRVAQLRAAPAAAPAPPAPATIQTSRQTSRLTLERRQPHRPRLPFRSPRHAQFPLVWDWGVPLVVDTLDAPLSARVPTGGVQLDVQPWRASVFVDGDLAGRVDDFSGYYRHLELAAGPHRIVIVEDDYDPLVIDVVVAPGRTTTYRGTLSRSLNR